MTITNPAESGSSTAVSVSSERARNLRRWNTAMAVLHAVQGVLMLVLSNDFAIEVGARYPQGPPGQPLDAQLTTALFDLPLGPATAAFLLLSAIAHGVIVTVGWDRYLDELANGRNRFRWVEYALSSTLMIVLIGALNVTEFSGLFAIAGANVAMILFGWVMEMVNRPGERVWWTPFTFGCVAGIVPWVVIAFYLLQPGADGGESAPGFVYGIVFTIFVAFNSFALNQWAQYARVGRWRDCLVGEKTYQVLSLVAKSLLAWQVFANVLVS